MMAASVLGPLRTLSVTGLTIPVSPLAWLVLLVVAALAARNAQKRKAAPPRRFLQR